MYHQRTILRVCTTCRRGFLATATSVKRDGAHYCGMRCVGNRFGATPEARLLTRTRRGPHCWEWTGYRAHFGHGQISVNGRPTGTHRLAWELAYGPIPPGMAVLHHCDNPPCVRPDHLFLGTQPDNIRDMIAKGRRGTTTLRDEDVREIRRLHAAGGITQVALARQFNVAYYTISLILSRKTWPRLE